MLFSLLEWYIIPLSNFNASLYFLLLIQTTVFFIFNLVSFPAFSPPNPWCKLSIGVLHCVPKPAAKKTLQWFPSKQNTRVTRFYTSDSVKSLFSFTDSLNSVSPLYFCIKYFPPLYFLPVFLSVSQTRAASLSPPPYVVILISCSGLVSFVLLLLTCLCCKRGGVGFNVSLQHVRNLFTSLCFCCFVTPFVHACVVFI